MRISAQYYKEFIDNLKFKRIRQSSIDNYQTIWKQFNKFLIRLDKIPEDWEERATLFCGYLIEEEKKSATVKSYMSVIKFIVIAVDDYNWDDKKLLVSSLTRVYRRINDKVTTRLPIHWKLLEVILFKIERIFDQQIYFKILYKALFAIGYYGLFREGELTQSPHVIRANSVHVGQNKDKILIVLYSSKTHNIESEPQQVKIKSNKKDDNNKDVNNSKNNYSKNSHFCPFVLMRQYINIREPIASESEQFFVFRNGSAVKPKHMRDTLNTALRRIGLNQQLYSVHSLRSGRSSDLIKFGLTIEQVKLMGRWKSNAVYRYIHTI